MLVFHIRTQTNTHCEKFIVSELTADRTEKLENGCHFSVHSK